MQTKPKIQIDLAKVEELAQVCDNEEEIALALGVSYATLRNRKKESSEFSNAIKRGKAKANVFVGGKLLGLVRDGNVAATIFWAKSRMGWRETQKLDLSSSDGTMSPALPDVKSLPKEQVDALVDRAYKDEQEP